MSEGPELVSITDGGKTTADKVVESALEELLRQSLNPEVPIRVAAIYLSYLAGVAAASIHVMDEPPEWLSADPGNGLTVMANSMRDDLFDRNPDIGWMQEIIEPNGFTGWAFILAGEAEDERVQILLYYNRSQGIFAAWKRPGANSITKVWIPEGMIEGHPAQLEMECLITFTELTHFARIRWEQYGISVCENPGVPKG